MQRFINIILILLFFLFTSIGEPEPLPVKIKLNELYTWNVKRNSIELGEDWLICLKNGTKDSLANDAFKKIERIKNDTSKDN